MVTNERVYEHEIDAVIASILRHPDSSPRFLEKIGLANTSVKTISRQKRHFGASGTIDIYAKCQNNAHLLIENKIDAGFSVTVDGVGQCKRYESSVKAITSYNERAFSILIAPEIYIVATKQKQSFSTYISYEELMEICDDKNDQDLLRDAISQAKAPYIPVNSPANQSTFLNIYEMVQSHFLELVLKKPPNASNARPKESVTVYVDVPKTLIKIPNVPRPKMSLQLRETGAKIMLPKFGPVLRSGEKLIEPATMNEIGAEFRRAGQSLGIVLPTERIFPEKEFEAQKEAVFHALEALDILRSWWNNNATEVKFITTQCRSIMA